MKKFMTLSMIFVLCFTLMTGCGEKPTEDPVIEPAEWATESPEEAEKKASVDYLAGEWQCRDATREQHGIDDAIYVGYMKMTIDEDGSFVIKDIENDDQQVLAGKLEVSGENKLSMKCEGDFFPPECWEGMEEKQDLTYLVDFAGGKDILLLTYTNADGVTSTLMLDRVKQFDD